MEQKSSELFDLCKQVYEKTGWKDDDIDYYARWQKFANLYVKVNRWEYDNDSVRYRNSPTALLFKEENEVAPLYTSDYLLEKLPLRILQDRWLTLSPLDSLKREWEVGYYGLDRDYRSYVRYSDTPLKALLLLTLALSEAGEL